MAEQIKAKDAVPGRWYDDEGGIRLLCTYNENHRFIFAKPNGAWSERAPNHTLTPLLDCTGWDWGPAPEHPPVPEGWRLVDPEKDGPKQKGDRFWNRNASNWLSVHKSDAGWVPRFFPNFTYIRRIEPAYRPFASAEEFRPHRERWWKYKDDSRETVRQPFAYSDLGHGNETWAQSLGRKVFDDGTPFGVEVKE